MRPPCLQTLAALTWRQALIIWIPLITGCTFLAYYPVLSCDFVNYDDHLYVTENAMVLQGLSGDGFKWAFTTGAVANWHPLTWLSHMLDCEWYGSQPKGHHASSLILHLFNSWLVLVLVHRLTGWVWRSGLLALVFAVHPLHVESVAWVSERKDVLSAFFGLLSLAAYLSYARARATVAESEKAGFKPAKRLTRLWVTYGLTTLFLALGLMSKPMLVTLPFVFLLLDWRPLRRADWPASVGQLKNWGKLVAEKAPWFLGSIAVCIITLKVQRGGNAFAMGDGLTWVERSANAVVAYAIYLGQMIWPVGLSASYPFEQRGWMEVAGAGAVLALVTVLIGWKVKAVPRLMVGWLWFLGMMVPVIGLVQVGAQAHADRYMYLPMLGLLLALPSDFASQWWGTKARQFGMVIGGLLVIGGLTFQTWSQTQKWRDSETLWSHALQLNPNNPVAHYSLGLTLGWSNQVDQAAAHFEETLRIWPTYGPALSDLGQIRMRQGRVDEAIGLYERAIELTPQESITRYNLGLAWKAKGQLTKAIACFEEALRLNPQLEDVDLQLAITLTEAGQFESALQAWSRQEQNSKNASNPSFYFYKAQTLNQLKRHVEARLCLEKAVSLSPDNPQLYEYQAMTSEILQDWTAAIAQYSTALRLQTNLPASLNNLAWILAAHPNEKLRDGPRAVQLAEQACKATNYQQPFFIGTLAAAYAEAGNFEKAVTTAQKAIDLAQQNHLTSLAEKNAELLGQYQNHQAYRDTTMSMGFK